MMRNIRTKIALVLVALVATAAGVVVSASPALAATDPFQQACNGGAAGGSAACSGGGGADPLTGSNGILITITNILALVAGAVALFFVITGGIKYITSNGDSSAVASAKNTIIYALIGLVVAALARPMINFVLSKIN